MNIRGIFLVVILFLLLPLTTHAQVRINEIAWMGSSESANAEWIELYNDSDTEVVLDGWAIVAYDGSPKINLVGPIGPGEYYLLERTSDTTVPSVLADSIYSGSLVNSGERLQLIDEKGVVVADMDFSSGWPGGDNSTKQTMQWTGDTWVTADPTPAAENARAGNPDEGESDSAAGVNSSDGQSATSSGSGGSSQKKITGVEVIPVEPNHSYSAQIHIPDYGVVGVPIEMKVVVMQDKKRDMVSGRFEWYMGDGGAYRYFTNTVINHQFMHPGEYTVVLEYYSNSMKDEIDSIHKKKIIIIPDAVSVQEVLDNGGITIKNSSIRDIDLHRWKLEHGQSVFTIPKYTIVKKGGTLTIPAPIHAMKITAGTSTNLVNPASVVVSRFGYGMLGP